MLSIIRKNGWLYVSHMMTFSAMAILSLSRGRPHLVAVMAILAPIWLASSVLWSEREDSSAFLRTLPITDREVARAKFTLLLIAAGVYWLILFAVARTHAGPVGSMVPGLGFVTMSVVVGLIAGALVYVGIWFFGQTPMTVLVVLFSGVGVLAAIATASRAGIAVLDGTSPGLGIGTPWYAVVAVLALGLLAYYGLMEVAVRVRRLGEAPR